MEARIHRGAREIGGTCIELTAQGDRLVLDLGRPLWAEPGDVVPLPDIPALLNGDRSVQGVLLSHGHPDHYGLVDQLPSDVPVFASEAATRILNEASFFTGGTGLDPAGFLSSAETLQLGAFSVTPYLIDHSAYDAFAFLISADGRRLFYTGDFRAHGRKETTFERLLANPPDVDVLVLEGTRLSRDERVGAEISNERDVEAACCDMFAKTTGMALTIYSPQNIDRYVSIYRAALRADRDLVIDLYTAAVAAATERPTIPQADWDRVRVFVPQSQRVKVKRARDFDRVNELAFSCIYPEDLADAAGSLVMTFRASMANDLVRAQCLGAASAIWSMWPGYLKGDRSAQLKKFLERHDIPLSVIHASGHATIRDLQRFAAAIAADRVVPIHTAAPERFEGLFERVERHPDGEWWEV